jgi:hypothetical protein
MRLLARGLGCLAVLLLPAVAFAEGAGPGKDIPPPGGPAPAPPSGKEPGKEQDPFKSTGSIGGATFSDKPARPAARFVARHTGPLATFPGFEQLPDGGSRLFVHVSQGVPIEERRAPGTVTYVLRGAHLRVHNDANALVTVHFNTPVFRARLAPQGNDLLFILEMRSAASPSFTMQASPDKSATLRIDFPKGDFVTGDGTEPLPPPATTPAGPAARRASRGRRAAPAPAQPAPGEPAPRP